MSKLIAIQEDDKLLVNKHFIMAYFGIAMSTITNWINKGFEKEKVLNGKTMLYDFHYALQWEQENIKKDQANRRKSTPDEMFDENDLDIKEVSEKEASRRKKINEVILGDIKIDEEKKRLVPKEDIEKTAVELCAIFISNYKNDLKILPVDLENLNKQKIKNNLEKHYKDRVLSFKSNIKIDLGKENTIYELLITIVELLKQGVDVSELLDADNIK